MVIISEIHVVLEGVEHQEEEKEQRRGTCYRKELQFSVARPGWVSPRPPRIRVSRADLWGSVCSGSGSGQGKGPEAEAPSGAPGSQRATVKGEGREVSPAPGSTQVRCKNFSFLHRGKRATPGS